MKIRSSTKFVLSTVALGAVIWGGMEGLALLQTAGVDLASMEPGKVNLIWVDPKIGYHVKVTNAVANLYQGSAGSFESPGKPTEGGGKRLPIVEMLASLQGDAKALGTFVEVVNQMNQSDEPLSANEWLAEDVTKALEGDAALRQKLEADLNIGLDGVPTRSASYYALNNGITILLKVKAHVPQHPKLDGLVTTVRIRYQPKLSKDVMEVLDWKVNPSPAEIAGIYSEKARPIWDYQAELAKHGGSLLGKDEDVVNAFNKLVATGKIAPPLDIRSDLMERVSDANSKQIGSTAEKILSGINVLVNEDEISGCEIASNADRESGELYDLKLSLKEGGRKRLWKFSRQEKDFVLLVIVDGVAIAAPHIGTQLAGSEVTISNLRDKRLTESAAEKIKKFAQSGDRT